MCVLNLPHHCGVWGSVVSRIWCESSIPGGSRWKSALILTSDSDKTALDAALCHCMSVASECDTLARVLSDLQTETARQHDQIDSVVCTIHACKSLEVALSTHADASTARVSKLVSKVYVFLDLVTSVGSFINVERETILRTFDTEFDRMYSAIFDPLPPVWLLLTRPMKKRVMSFCLRCRLLQHYQALCLILEPGRWLINK